MKLLEFIEMIKVLKKYNMLSTVLLLLSCSTGKIILTDVAIFNTEDVFDYIELVDSINIEIIDYIPAYCSCGVYACASICIGKTLDSDIDTLRVLTICNTDTTYRQGMKVKVIPQEKRDFEVWTSTPWIVDGQKVYIPRIHRTKFKTVYGRLEK